MLLCIHGTKYFAVRYPRSLVLLPGSFAPFAKATVDGNEGRIA
jgi:hypothetical protein